MAQKWQVFRLRMNVRRLKILLLTVLFSVLPALSQAAESEEITGAERANILEDLDMSNYVEQINHGERYDSRKAGHLMVEDDMSQTANPDKMATKKKRQSRSGDLSTKPQ